MSSRSLRLSSGWRESQADASRVSLALKIPSRPDPDYDSTVIAVDETHLPSGSIDPTELVRVLVGPYRGEGAARGGYYIIGPTTGKVPGTSYTSASVEVRRSGKVSTAFVAISDGKKLCLLTFSPGYRGRHYDTFKTVANSFRFRDVEVPTGELADLSRFPDAGPRQNNPATDLERYRKAREFTRKWEGGFVDHPKDPGGRTNKGITQRTYDAYRKSEGPALRDVRDVADKEVEEIYHERYWKASGADVLALPLAMVHFDTAVNFGVGRAKQWLPEITKDHTDPLAAARAYVQKRIDYRHQCVEQNPSQKVFLKGWLNRDNALLKAINSLGGKPE